MQDTLWRHEDPVYNVMKVTFLSPLCGSETWSIAMKQEHRSVNRARTHAHTQSTEEYSSTEIIRETK
jgi:hypothetical protein